jgi:hypothetical protein
MPCPSIGPKLFWTVQIVLVGSKSFWLGPNHFGQVQIIAFWSNFYNLDLSKMIWTKPKQIGSVQNDWYSTKIIWTVQNNFGPIEGRGISLTTALDSDLVQFFGRFGPIFWTIWTNFLDQTKLKIPSEITPPLKNCCTKQITQEK